MDPEKLPLLASSTNCVRYRGLTPLTYEEVLEAQNRRAWRCSRLILVLMFWAIIAMFLSMIVSILVSASNCQHDLPVLPSVPPVHMSFGPLISSGSSEGKTYTL